jgi:hypothetical protein
LSRFADNVYALVASYARSGAAPYKVPDLLDAMGRNLRDTGEASDLVGGSLFQLVAGAVGKGVVDRGSLDNFTIVDSSELHDIHGVRSVPKPFDFDS